MKAATTAVAAREKGNNSVATVLFFFSLFLFCLQRRCVPFLFKILAVKKEGTAVVRSDGEVEGSGGGQLRAKGSSQRSRLYANREMATAGNGYCKGGLGYGCMAVMRHAARSASDGGGLRGCIEEEQRVMTTGVVVGCNGMGEKEADETEVAGKRRRQQPTMDGSGGWRPELAVAVVKKADGWLRLWVDCVTGGEQQGSDSVG
ncbi:hypothetical protein B296_00046177 [Ensete ventricosum]|uniref:Uncharacterized protein n=1 Tax=Ensete ventricosum TaxID=4639 RepID=A0A426XGV5_ENSVE|nr:hypothetical protein B296_00046177 [Ensete ventricosum]